jgi:hypothetical protein
LVDNDETFWLFVRSNSLITNGILELDNLLQSVVDESSFRFDQLLPLLGGRVEESRVYLAIRQLSPAVQGTGSLRFLVFKRYVQGKDEGILNLLWHIRMPSSVIHDQTPDQLSIGIRLVLHLHDLNHVQINRLRGFFTALNGEDGIDDISSEALCQLGV